MLLGTDSTQIIIIRSCDLRMALDPPLGLIRIVHDKVVAITVQVLGVASTDLDIVCFGCILTHRVHLEGTGASAGAFCVVLLVVGARGALSSTRASPCNAVVEWSEGWDANADDR